MNKKILFILGMHRSGTSALAGAIHASGIHGGQRLMDPSFDNEKGFYENQDAVEINENILKSLGLSWDSPFHLPDHWAFDSQLQKHREAIRHFLVSTLGSHPSLYIKDPRLSYLLPLWQQVVDELGHSACYLITLRPPEEVYRSLHARNSIARNKALALWLNHMLLAEKKTRGLRRLFVPYNELLESPLQLVENIFQSFQLGDWQSRKEQVKAFIDKKLKHQQAPQGEDERDSLPYYQPLAGYFYKLAQMPDDQETLAKIDETGQLFLFNQGFFTPEKEKQYYATLRIESGRHTRMIPPMKIPVYEGLSAVVFPLDNIRFPIERALVYPCNELCHVSLRSMVVRYADGSSDILSSFDGQAIIEHGSHHFFGEMQHLSLQPDTAKQPREIVLNLQYESIGKAALQSLARVSSDIKDWFYAKMGEQETAFTQHLEELTGKVLSKDALLEQADRQAEEMRVSFIEYRNEKEEKITSLESEIERMAREIQLKGAAIASLEEAAAMLNQQINGMGQANDNLLQRIDSLLQEITGLEGTITGLRQAAEALSHTIAADKQEIANQQDQLKKKDELIWEIYAHKQQLEGDYHQSLRTLDDVRISFAYRLGRGLTFPLRFFYDLLSKKPINETSLWLAWQFLAAGVKMPGRMLSNINAKNIGTLRKALKNESPREIAGNLGKLLAGRSATVAAGQAGGASAPAMPIAEPVAEQPPVFAQPEMQNGHAEKVSGPPMAGAPAKKTILFASPFLPDFDGSSGGKRATRMLGLLAESFEVYAFTLGDKPEKHIQKLESLGVRVFRGNDFGEVKKIVPRVDTLVFSFFYTYFDCDKFLAMYPNAQLIVDSVDVHWVRHERSRGLWAELTDDVVQKKKVLEIMVYQKADIVWAVTEQDRQAILAEVPDADVRIVSNVHSPIVETYSDPGSNDLLFMGGFAHYPNIIAVKKLAMDIFPKIREQVPSARLVIAGSNAPPDVIDLGKLPRVEFLGFIEEGSMRLLYENTFLAIAPLQAGAGIKGKICEAISYMVPVVTNSIGNEGIGLENEKSGLISDDDKELVNLAVKALRRQYDLAQMTRNAQGKLYGLVGPKTVKRNMLDSMDVPEVSICIVTWNKLPLLQRCIESIEEHTHGIRYRILVYSNGCTDGTREYLTAAARINPDIVPILSDTNDVFVIPNNRMMQMFPENDAVLLNNDTYVTEGWLQALRDAAYSSPDIGIAGAKLLYPDGKLQEFGSELYADGTGRNIGKWDDPDREEYNHPKYAGYVSGCAFYIKRSTMDKIGVFDEAFHPCYCEDSDYCYTAWEQGLATLVTPDCVVYHDEGSTSGTDTSTGFKAYQKVNFEKFLKKHAHRLDETATKIKLKNLMLNKQLATPVPSGALEQ